MHCVQGADPGMNDFHLLTVCLLCVYVRFVKRYFVSFVNTARK
jgi:hypothetical protein